MSKKPFPQDKPEILTLDELADFLRVSRRTINKLVAAEAIPFLRLGSRVVRFKRQTVSDWLRAQNHKKDGR